MLSSSDLFEPTKEIVPENQQFRMDAPSGPQLATGAPVSFTKSKGSFAIEWTDEELQETGATRVEHIFDDIIARSRRDVEANSSSARARINLGSALLNRGYLNEAVNEFEAALVSDPNHFLAKASIARIKAIQGQFTEATNLYESLRTAHPESPIPIMNLAYISMRRNAFENAIELLQEAIKLDERDLGARYQIAVALLGVGKPRDAIRHLKIAARSDVLSPRVHHSLGVAYAIAGDTPRAIRSFKTALTLAPDMRETVHALSKTLLLMHEAEQAVELLSNYLEKKPEDLDARSLFGHALLELGRYSQARIQFSAALEALRDRTAVQRVELLNNIGVCFARQRNLEEAALWYVRAINSNPSQIVTPHHNLARVRLLEGNFEAAQNILDASLVFFPGDLDTYVIYSLSLRKRGLYDEAIRELQSLVDVGKVNADIYSNLGSLLADERRDYTSSAEVLREGHTRFPDDLLVSNNLAYTLLMIGDVDAAEKILNSLQKDLIVRDRRISATLMATRGLLHLRKGEIQSGIELYSNAESLARRIDDAELAQTARQKLHLELARCYQQSGDLSLAAHQVKLGLGISGGKEAYEEDLRRLRGELSSR
jgi:tetratricopeptide (TPR) repeat protein